MKWRLARTALAMALALSAGAMGGCFSVETPATGGDQHIGGEPIVGGMLAADVRIVRHPRGGTNVIELSCTFEAVEVPGTGPEPIAIHVNWVAPCGTHKTETFVFEGGSERFESIYAEGGYPIGMTFWTTIAWTDATGSHRIRSDVAPCTIR